MAKGISNKIPVASVQRFPIKKTMLALCVGAAIQPNAYAQESSSGEASIEGLEEVTVYGVRQSLKNASDIKRNADTHVDAISAVDIGALPDVSVLEALQRVPGVSIERFAASDDPDHFSTEGSGITLRGLPNTRSEFNGRDSFSANVGRGLSFSDVSPELLGSVEIYKNQTADQIEGGVSGIVNLNTRKPFDSEGRNISFSGSASYGDLEEELTPNFSGLYSDRFQIAAGEIGVLASYAKSDLDFRSDGVELGRPGPAGSNGINAPVSSATPDGGQAFIPINGGIRSTSTNREREGLSLAVQFRNNAENFDALFEYIKSEGTNNWLEHAFFSDDSIAQSGFNGTGASADSIFAGGAFQSGTLENIQGGFGPQTRRSNTENQTEDFSLNFKFRPNDRLSLSTDFQYVQSTRTNVDLGVFGGLDVNNSFRSAANARGIDNQVTARGDTPELVFRAPSTSSQTDAEFFTDPANFFFRAAIDHLDDADGDEFATRFDAEYDLEFDFIQSVQAGVRFAERDQTTRNSTFNWGNISETWSGGRALFDGTPGQGFRADPNVSGTFAAGEGDVELFDFGNFHAGDVTGFPGGQALFPSARLVDNFATFSNEIAPFRNSGTLAGRPGANADGFLPAEVTSTNEENTSAYIRFNFGLDGDNRLDGNVGLRYIRQETTVAGGFVFPQANSFSNLSRFAPGQITPEILAFANGGSRNGDLGSTFDKVLPSLNIKYEVNDNLIARFGASSTVTYPNIGDLAFNFAINAQSTGNTTTNGVPNNDATFDGFTAISGNPFLQPTESDNFDLSAEYYFGDGGDYVSLGVFYKDLKNFVVAGSSNFELENNGVIQTVQAQTPTNIGDANLAGIEFAYQQFFSNGFGVQLNYTYLDPSDVPTQNTRPLGFTGQADLQRTTNLFEDLPLQGLSENQFNLVGLYQSDKIEARLAYNWRDDYLLTARQVNLGVPVFAEARGQLDGSFFYTINDNFDVGLQGTNLLQDEVVTNIQVDGDGTQVFRSSFVFDRRFTLLLRAKF